MDLPRFKEIKRHREMTSVFGGYNHQLSCAEGQFYDMRNMTSQHYPILSPRPSRRLEKVLVNPQGILDKEDLLIVDDGKMYRNGEEVSLGDIVLTEGYKTLAKMGAFVVIMPDKVWYNADTGESGYMGASYDYTGAVSVTLCEQNGKIITWNNAEYYDENEPQNGDYMMSIVNGKASLKQYSSITSLWASVASAYLQVSAPGIGKAFDKEDGVKITVGGVEWEYGRNIFVNDEGDGNMSTNTYIADKTDDSITFIGLIDSNKAFNNMHVKVERLIPDMTYITECNNRLWGCSPDGHEIYCCKLGDVKNWNCYQGLSTDSWAVTIGSDGKFTGAITYLGYPMFFKEDSFIKISVSATGGHQTKESRVRGVQRGSDKSLAILNETLFYKSPMGICAYSGGMPTGISDSLGEVRYHDAVGGTIGNRYYVSMKDSDNVPHLFVFDHKTGIWSKEDNTEALFFCKHDMELFYISADKHLIAIGGTNAEERFDWFVESGTIGYNTPDNQYVTRINVRIAIDFGTNVDFYLRYDGGAWEHQFNMGGKTTRTFTVPVTPRRCDHFEYKITGRGGCKIFSVTKTLEEGSDIR